MIKQKLFTAMACASLAALGWSSGDRAVLREIRDHLELARKNVSEGKLQGALAHATVVYPDHRIKVRVDCDGLPANSQGLFRNALSGAFALWEDALGQKTFEVTLSDKADVVIRFQSRVASNGAEVCGHATWTRAVDESGKQPRAIFAAELWVSTSSPSGAALDFDQIRACAAHELGHVLGLGDSRNAGDLMGPMDLKHPVTRIRPDEVSDLIEARGEAARIRNSVTYGFIRPVK